MFYQQILFGGLNFILWVELSASEALGGGGGGGGGGEDPSAPSEKTKPRPRVTHFDYVQVDEWDPLAQTRLSFIPRTPLDSPVSVPADTNAPSLWALLPLRIQEHIVHSAIARGAVPDNTTRETYCSCAVEGTIQGIQTNEVLIPAKCLTCATAVVNTPCDLCGLLCFCGKPRCRLSVPTADHGVQCSLRQVQWRLLFELKGRDLEAVLQAARIAGEYFDRESLVLLADATRLTTRESPIQGRLAIDFKKIMTKVETAPGEPAEYDVAYRADITSAAQLQETFLGTESIQTFISKLRKYGDGLIFVPSLRECEYGEFLLSDTRFPDEYEKALKLDRRIHKNAPKLTGRFRGENGARFKGMSFSTFCAMCSEKESERVLFRDKAGKEYRLEVLPECINRTLLNEALVAAASGGEWEGKDNAWALRWLVRKLDAEDKFVLYSLLFRMCPPEMMYVLLEITRSDAPGEAHAIIGVVRYKTFYRAVLNKEGEEREDEEEEEEGGRKGRSLNKAFAYEYDPESRTYQLK